MGEETAQFATRYSTALARLAELGDDRGYPKLVKQHGAKLAAVVRDALDAVGAVHETGTEAVRSWPERRQRVLEQVGAMRAALARAGIDDEVRRMARALVEHIEPRR